MVIGAGGHGKVVADAMQMLGKDVLGFLDMDTTLHGTLIAGLKVLGNDNYLRDYSYKSVGLANGIGSIVDTKLRYQVYAQLTMKGYNFQIVRHPSAIISSSVELSDGVQVMAGAVLQCGVSIGANTIINTGALIDHDCTIGSHCHVAPGAVLSGGVKVEDGCHIGTSASVIQGITIGSGALIAAGAVVVENVPAGACVAGVPARIME